ncbi:hypothetical protein [Natrinema salinisoli]|uniref:hypothetical protein n=1 Tax=Natrinema salinisoli TaxID=2878535 RepID=UPI001CEFB9B1|nr:hypothetical protein [Natrinema salinisoli]
MLGLLAWLGIGIFSVALAYDFYTEWFAPRLLSQSWFPGEPDLPPVAGDVDDPGPEEYRRVILAAYLTGAAILFIGLLDAAPVSPMCLPYTNFINEYIVGILALVTGFMWYSDGQGVVIPYHSEIRYTIGVLTVVAPLYMSACGSGIL